MKFKPNSFGAGFICATACFLTVLAFHDLKISTFVLAVIFICLGIYAFKEVANAEAEKNTRLLFMEKALTRVANLNPKAGEIGAGMLATIIGEARAVLEWEADE